MLSESEKGPFQDIENSPETGLSTGGASMGARQDEHAHLLESESQRVGMAGKEFRLAEA